MCIRDRAGDSRSVDQARLLSSTGYGLRRPANWPTPDAGVRLPHSVRETRRGHDPNRRRAPQPLRGTSPTPWERKGLVSTQKWGRDPEGVSCEAAEGASWPPSRLPEASCVNGTERGRTLRNLLSAVLLRTTGK